MAIAASGCWTGIAQKVLSQVYLDYSNGIPAPSAIAMQQLSPSNGAAHQKVTMAATSTTAPRINGVEHPDLPNQGSLKCLGRKIQPQVESVILSATIISE